MENIFKGIRYIFLMGQKDTWQIYSTDYLRRRRGCRDWGRINGTSVHFENFYLLYVYVYIKDQANMSWFILMVREEG